MTAHPIYKILTWLFLVLGLAGSVMAAYWVKRDIDRHEYQEFSYYCVQVKLRIMSQLKAHEQILLGGAALFDSSQHVTRQEWQTYTQRLHINKHFQGIQGLGFALWLPAAQLAKHQASIRAEGFSNYTVHPEGQREFYSSVIYLEPFTERNLQAFGYDMYSEPVQRLAMIRARDDNQITLSGSVALAQQTDKNVQVGTLMYAPVYQKNQPIDTVEQRRTALYGWVYSLFRMNDLLTDILSSTNTIQANQIRLRVYDGDNTATDHLLYDSQPDDKESDTAKRTFSIELSNDFNGTTWKLRFEKTIVVNQINYITAWITLFIGMVISMLLFLLASSYLSVQSKATAIAKRLTKQLQESENRFRVLADSAPVLIWMSGLDKGCYHFNKVWLDFTGHTLEQEQNNGWIQNIHPDDLQNCLSLYHQAFDARLPFKIEYRLRRYDGEYRWLLDNGVPRFADDGTFLGYIGSCIDITELKWAERELKKEQRQLQSIITGTNAGTWEWNVQTGEVIFNERWAHIVGYQLSELQPISIQTWTSLCHPDDLKHSNELLKQHFAGQLEYYDCECRLKHKQGHWVWVMDRGRIISYTEDGKPLLMAGTHIDISHLKQIEEELRIAATVFESQEGMLVTDANQIIIKANRAFSHITGYSAAEIMGKTLYVLQSDRHDAKFYQAMWQNIHTTGAWQGEVWNRRKNGEVYPEQLSISAVKNQEGVVTHYVATFSDITERKSTEEYINRLAFYDALTQLPNRRLLQERLKYCIEMYHRTGRQIAVFMMDLDKFKAVNDTLGHAAGDELLQQVAKRVKGRLREVDMVARLGGDEFVILIDNVTRQENLGFIAESIINTLCQSFTIQNHEVYIGASIGIAIHPQHGDTVDALIDHADTALYHAKGQGRGRYVYFSDALTQKIRDRIELEARLRDAINQQKLSINFQPQISIITGHIIGAEVLVRWYDIYEGCLMPNEFISFAEETGLIIPIGEWVLKEACKFGKKWLDNGLATISISVNISPYQFHRADMMSLVTKILEETHFPASHLALEITETGLMNNQEQALAILNDLHDLGVQLVIDNFGTGYSSLSHLKHLPIHTLKIDKTFIKDIPFSQEDCAIASSIIAMAHHLGVRVLAEGVETYEQYSFLRQQGCDAYQGYWHSEPLPANLFALLLQSEPVPD